MSNRSAPRPLNEEEPPSNRNDGPHPRQFPHGDTGPIFVAILPVLQPSWSSFYGTPPSSFITPSPQYYPPPIYPLHPRSLTFTSEDELLLAAALVHGERAGKNIYDILEGISTTNDRAENGHTFLGWLDYYIRNTKHIRERMLSFTGTRDSSPIPQLSISGFDSNSRRTSFLGSVHSKDSAAPVPPTIQNEDQPVTCPSLEVPPVEINARQSGCPVVEEEGRSVEEPAIDTTSCRGSQTASVYTDVKYSLSQCSGMLVSYGPTYPSPAPAPAPIHSPTPPAHIVNVSPRKNLFNLEDKLFLKKTVRHMLMHNPSVTLNALSKQLFKKATHHTFGSWRRYICKNWALVQEIRREVKVLKKGSSPSSNKEGYRMEKEAVAAVAEFLVSVKDWELRGPKSRQVVWRLFARTNSTRTAKQWESFFYKNQTDINALVREIKGKINCDELDNSREDNHEGRAHREIGTESELEWACMNDPVRSVANSPEY